MTAVVAHNVTGTNAGLLESADSPSLFSSQLGGQENVTLYVSEDELHWYPMTFEGESSSYLDRRVANWIIKHRGLTIQLDDVETRWGLLPRTFSALFMTPEPASAPMAVAAF